MQIAGILWVKNTHFIERAGEQVALFNKSLGEKKRSWIDFTRKSYAYVIVIYIYEGIQSSWVRVSLRSKEHRVPLSVLIFCTNPFFIVWEL